MLLWQPCYSALGKLSCLLAAIPTCNSNKIVCFCHAFFHCPLLKAAVCNTAPRAPHMVSLLVRVAQASVWRFVGHMLCTTAIGRCKHSCVVKTCSKTRWVGIQRCSLTDSLTSVLSLLSTATGNVTTCFGQVLIICVSSLWEGSSAGLFLSNTSPHESCSAARAPRQYVNTNNK